MIIQNHIRGRRRVLNDAKKARLCELIAHESYSVEAAAESLDVSLRTVELHRQNVFQKMGADSLAELVRMVVAIEGPRVAD